MSKSIQTARRCALIPLAGGVSIYVLWRITRADLLMILGGWTLILGLALFLVGLAFLAHHVMKAEKAERRKALPVFALLCLNFPVAAACIFSALEVHSRYTLTVINDSAREISDFTVSGAGISENMGSIAPGESAREHFHASAEGSIDFTAKHGEKPLGGCIEGYSTVGLGGHATVRIRPDGTWAKDEG